MHVSICGATIWLFPTKRFTRAPSTCPPQLHNTKPGTNLQQNKQLKSEILTFGHMYTDNAHVREPVKHNSLRMKIYISTMYALYEYIYIYTHTKHMYLIHFAPHVLFETPKTNREITYNDISQG